MILSVSVCLCAPSFFTALFWNINDDLFTEYKLTPRGVSVKCWLWVNIQQTSYLECMFGLDVFDTAVAEKVIKMWNRLMKLFLYFFCFAVPQFSYLF